MDYSGKHRPVRPLEAADDFNHVVENHTFFNESRYIHLIDGAQRIGGWFRIGQRPNQGYAEMTVCLHLPDGQVGFMFAKPEMSVADGLEAAGLSFSIDEPFRRMRLHYTGKLCVMPDGRAMEDPKRAFREHPLLDCVVDLEFTAIGPAHGGELLEDDGRPFDEGEDRYFARAHYDQHVRGAGELQVGDQRYRITGFGLRDHSWGPRIWQAIPWYRWFPCAFDGGFAICLLVVRKGDGEYVETGFIHDGSGKPLHASNIRLQTRYDANQYPIGFTLHCQDDQGRHYEIRGESLSSVPCRHWRAMADGRIDKSRIVECMTRYRCDDRVGYGMAEYMDHLANGEFEGIAAGH
jgi:hypothetical protein